MKQKYLNEETTMLQQNWTYQHVRNNWYQTKAVCFMQHISIDKIEIFHVSDVFHVFHEPF